MTRLLLDTHALIWFVEKDPKLGKKTLSAIMQLQGPESLCISAISFWEIGMLTAGNRLTFHRPLSAWRSDILAAGITELPVDGEVALRATQITWDHPDPADRMIVANAFTYGCTLITADSMILDWKHGPLTLNARY